jgi:hypothetical protein
MPQAWRAAMTATEDMGPPRFIRRIVTPAAAPWDQQRAADHDARHNSPLLADQVMIQVRRVGAWRPGEPATFAAAYLRKTDVTGPVTLAADIAGQSLTFSFAPPQALAALRRAAVVDLAVAVVAIALLVLAAAVGWSRREANEAALAAAQHTDDRAIRLQTLAGRRAKTDAALAAAGLEARNGSALLRDFAWLAKARNPNAVLQSVVWDGGTFTLQSSDQAQPLLAAAPAQAERQSGEERSWRIQSPAGAKASPPAPTPTFRSVSIAPAVVDHGE